MKVEEARQRFEQAITRNIKRARVLKEAQLRCSPAAGNRPVGSVLFQVQQDNFCTGFLKFIG